MVLGSNLSLAEVSSKVESCPHCGNVLNPKDGKLVMLQGTKNKWKMVKIVAWGLLLVGLTMLTNKNNVGATLITFSVITWIITKLDSWWTNG